MNKKIIILVIFIIIIIVISFYFVNKIELTNTLKDNLNKNIINDNRENQIMKLYLNINNKTLVANLENNSSVDALIEKLKEDNIIINMKDYGNFEKVGALGFNLPRNDKKITTEAGDIILYQGNSLTIYYDTNSWEFTKIGKIENVNREQLIEILGEGDVIVTLSLKNKFE